MVFWDHDEGEDQEPAEVADSFDAWLNAELRELDG